MNRFKNAKIHRMAECTSCGERIEDPEYVDGNPYCSVDAEVQRDYARAGALQEELKEKKRIIDRFD